MSDFLRDRRAARSPVVSDDGLAQVRGRMYDRHHVIDRGQVGVPQPRIADMQSASVGAGEGGGNAQEGTQDIANRRPVGCQTGLGPAGAEDPDRRGPVITAMKRGPSARRPFRMVDGAQTKLGHAGAEDGFDIREHRIRLPHDFRGPVETIGAQTIDGELVQH